MDLLNKLSSQLQQDNHKHLLKASAPFVTTLPQTTINDIQGFVSRFFAITHREKYQKQRQEEYSHEQNNFSAMMSYDFHISGDRCKLIEVNTNAGGGLFSLVSEFLHSSAGIRKKPLEENLRAIRSIQDSFCKEYALWSRGNNKNEELKSIAILDEDLANVYWLPEFQLFKTLFEEKGITVCIADITEAEIVGNKLVIQGREIDLVYNRYCDFYLKDERSKVLGEAYEKNYACFSPNPYEYHLTASKEVLSHLSLGDQDEILGITEDDREVLDRFLLKTYLLTEVDDDEIYAKRKKNIFKPRTFYGSKGVYRGDKISRKKLLELDHNEYLMQELDPPSVITVDPNSTDIELKSPDFKADYRFYTYKDEIFHVACRFFQGQVTNFQAPGSGFVPVNIETVDS